MTLLNSTLERSMKRNLYCFGLFSLLLFSLFLLTSGSLTSQTSASYWRAAGTGDCPGRDIGSSATSTPDAARCNAAFKGYTAVCWSGNCTYKNVLTDACTGGANPGKMYTCEAGLAADGSAIVNLALRKPATQSSVYRGTGIDQGPQFGNDGILESQPRDPYLLVLTDPNDANPPWWQVDLQGVYPLMQLKLYNRKACCQEQAKTVQVLLSTDGARWERAYAHNGTAFDVLTVDLTGRSARYVRLQLTQRGSLQFQECEVYGYASAPHALTNGSQPSPQSVASPHPPTVTPAPASGQTAAKPLTANVTPATAEVESGGKVDLWAKVSGGVPPYSYEWRNGESLSKVTAPSITYSNLNRLGGRDIRLTVKDSAGNSADAHATFTVHAAGEIVAASVPGAQPKTNATSASTVPSYGPSTAPSPTPSVKPSSTLSGNLAGTATAAPVVQPAQRVLPPFAGYAESNMCDSNRTDPPGVPWQGTTIKDGGPAVSAASTSGYNASVHRAMNGMLLLYGKMSTAEMNTFNALWAPYFNHPTSAAQTYFDHLNPLLDEVAHQIAILDGAVPRAGEAFTAALLDGVQRSSANTSAANVVFSDLKTQKKKLDDLIAKINALGNPPDPLAAVCAARARHHKALGGEQNVADMVKNSNFLWANLYLQHRFGDGGVWEVHPELRRDDWRSDSFNGGAVELHPEEARKYETEWHWQGNVLTMTWQTEGAGNSFNSPCGGQGWGTRDEVSMALSQDGKTLERVSFKRFEKRCDPKTSTVSGPDLRQEFELVNVPLVSAEVGPAGTNIIYGASGPSVGKYVASIKGGGDYKPAGDELRIRFSSGQKTIALVERQRAKVELLEVFQAIGNIVSNIFGSSPSNPAPVTPAPAAIAPAAPQAPAANTAGPPAKDPAILEAIAEHEALAAQDRESARRRQEQASNEKDPKVRADLEFDANHSYTDASDQEDQANSLRTGMEVHTRSQWDDRDAQLKSAGINKELNDAARENALLAEIPKTGEMLEGIDGVQYREQLQQRIQDAIHSPNPTAKLEDIYKDTRSHVVSQGQHEMASAQATVNLWESRVAAAEDVEWAAGTALSLSGLWAPEVAQLGLGYATVTGYVEDGVLGAGKNLVRGISPKADVLISAYEGAIAIDPSTGQPYGAEGALQGALTSAITNVAFEQIGKSVQRYKANMALARQAAGGPGFLPVARAGENPHLKEFDFKSPEERYQADLAAATTPEETQAVKDKNKIQVERAAMKQEKQQSLQQAEQRVRNGEDPAAVKADYSKQLSAVDEKYHGRESRNAEHAQVMKELGFDTGMDAMNPDIAPSGGEAKTAESDLDFVPKGNTPSEAYQKGRRYAEAMKSRGHNVYEYGDRWVDTTSDTTIWKPGFNGDLPGSSSFEAEAIFGTLPGSDKFGTRGGVEWTSGKAVPPDPRGVVLANLGKAAGAGLGSKRPVDLHVIGKSAQKVLDPAVSGIAVDPTLKGQLDALRNHQTPEQAGILTLGASEQQKAKEQQAFLDKVGDLMANAYKAASEKSNANLEKLQNQASTATDPTEAARLRIQVAAYQSSDHGALDTIGRVAPELAGKIAAANPPEPLKLAHESPSAAPVTPATEEKPPAFTFTANDPAFGDLGTRCKDAVIVLDGKIKEAKAGSDAAKYLLELQAALRAGGTNPATAILSVRNLSGRELSQVLSDLGIQPKK